MKYLIACACALILAFGSSSVAQAQIVYGYTFPTFGGVESAGIAFTPYGSQTFTSYFSPFTGFIGQTNGNFATPLGTKSFSNYFSPFTGLVGQSYTTNNFGAANSAIYGSNPFTGYRYGTGFYQPNALFAPGVGYNYSWLKWRR